MFIVSSWPDLFFPTSDSYDFVWEKALVATVAFFSLILGAVQPRGAWKWPLVMASAHYLSGFVLMHPWGQIPPLELVYVAVLAIPGIATAYLGAFLSKRFGNAT